MPLNAAGGQDGVLEVRDQLAQVAAAIRGNAGSFRRPVRRRLHGAAEGRAGTQCVRASAIRFLPRCWASWPSAARSNLLTRVAAAYEEQLGSKLNLSVVDVTTVVPLDDHLREVITKKAEAELGTKVVLREHVDKSLLGGIIMSCERQAYRCEHALRSWTSARTVLKAQQL